ncbi:hypothetical protein Taro_044924, partial [Colocasia esculenta]|nr:hypothetical protein [Colocasia esculenta]
AAVGEVQDLAVPGPAAPPARHVLARPHGPALRHTYLSKPWLFVISHENFQIFLTQNEVTENLTSISHYYS